MDNLTTATPVEIDTELARLYCEEQAAKARRDAAWNSIGKAVRDYLGKGYREAATPAEIRDVLIEISETPEAERTYRQSQIARLYDAADKAQNEADNALYGQQPLDEEYDRRGRWTRAFLVNNSNGHVHRTRACSTTYPTTQWLWLPEFSDHDEAEIVEAAGERACTVCYQSAPVEVLARPTQIFTPDEIEKQRARQEREAAKAAREAAQIVVEGYTDFGRVGTKTFKTERAVTNAIAGDLGSLVWYGLSHPSALDWTSNIEACRKALADKGIDYDYDKALTNARKKTVREGSAPQY